MTSLGPAKNSSSWKCTWCFHENQREHAGLDHCDKCNAETHTIFIAPDLIRVRYSRNPRRRVTSHLDCIGVAGCKASSPTYQKTD